MKSTRHPNVPGAVPAGGENKENKADLGRRDFLINLCRIATGAAIARVVPGCAPWYLPYDQNFDINAFGNQLEGNTPPEIAEIQDEQVAFAFDLYFEKIGCPLRFDNILEFADHGIRAKENSGESANGSQPTFRYTDAQNRTIEIIFSLERKIILTRDVQRNAYVEQAQWKFNPGQFKIFYSHAAPEITVNSRGLVCEGTTRNNQNLPSYYQAGTPDRFEINGVDSLLSMMGLNNGYEFPYSSTRPLNLTDIRGIDQLVRIYSYLYTPESLGAFLVAAIKARDDGGYRDEYKNPLQTLREGGDCDDDVVMSGFWAKLYGYEVTYIYVTNHVFAEVHLSENRHYVFDSRNLLFVEQIESLDEYMARHFPGQSVLKTENP